MRLSGRQTAEPRNVGINVRHAPENRFKGGVHGIENE
jgi:hypothetical protein